MRQDLGDAEWIQWKAEGFPMAFGKHLFGEKIVVLLKFGNIFAEEARLV